MKKSYLAKRLKQIKTERCQIRYEDIYGSTFVALPVEDVELKERVAIVDDEEIQYNRISEIKGYPF